MDWMLCNATLTEMASLQSWADSACQPERLPTPGLEDKNLSCYLLVHAYVVLEADLFI